MIKIEEKEKFNSRDRIVYVDMDGVIANFHGYFKELFGWDIPKISSDKKPEIDTKMWDQINGYGKSKFFEELPWISGSQSMWHFIIDNFVNVKILSALGKSDVEDGLTKKGKLLWLQHHLPNLKDEDIILVVNKHQKKHYSRTGDIIIDDTPSVIEDWNNKGGHGIFFKNAEDVINQLTHYVYKSI